MLWLHGRSFARIEHEQDGRGQSGFETSVEICAGKHPHRLLVFSAKGVETDWLYPLGPRDDAKLMQAIDRPQPGGGTPLGAYLKKGTDRLLEERAKQFGYGTFRLLVVTDGEAGDKELVERYTPEVIARGIKWT